MSKLSSAIQILASTIVLAVAVSTAMPQEPGVDALRLQASARHESDATPEIPRVRIRWVNQPGTTGIGDEQHLTATTAPSASGRVYHEASFSHAEAASVADLVERLNRTESCSGVTIWMETLDADIVPSLAAAKNLVSLTIVGSTFRAGSLRELRQCAALKFVSLDGWVVSDAACVELSRIRSLEYIQLTGSAVTDRGLKHLSAIKTLRELDLRGTRISDDGLESLQKSHALRLLDVRGTAVTPAGVFRLARALQKLQIHFQPTDRPPLQLVTR